MHKLLDDKLMAFESLHSHCVAAWMIIDKLLKNLYITKAINGYSILIRQKCIAFWTLHKP